MTPTIGISEDQEYNFVPQLPMPAEDPEVLLKSNLWALSQKLDGERMVIRSNRDALQAWGRSGTPRPLPATLTDAMMEVPAGWAFDGEYLDDTFYVFDILEAAGKSLLPLPFSQRFNTLTKALARRDHSMVLVGHAFNESSKREQFEYLRDNNKEGVVFKDTGAGYKSGKNRRWLKFKFKNHIDCFVTDKNINGKQNLEVSVYRNGDPVSIGKVSALDGDGDKLKIGDVCSVECLYTTAEGKLYQPHTPIFRTDKTAKECTWDQIEQAKTNKKVVVNE